MYAMVSRSVTLTNKSGLHARPASELARIASKCKSDITIKTEEKRINPKSVLNIMAAAIKCGTEVTVECNGETEEEDLKMIIEAIESGLGE
jgi:phosphocarrier protein HPr